MRHSAARTAKGPLRAGPSHEGTKAMNECARIIALPAPESRPKFEPVEALGQRLREIRIVVLGAIDDAELHADYSGVNRRMYGLVELVNEALELHGQTGNMQGVGL